MCSVNRIPRKLLGEFCKVEILAKIVFGPAHGNHADSAISSRLSSSNRMPRQ